MKVTIPPLAMLVRPAGTIACMGLALLLSLSFFRDTSMWHRFFNGDQPARLAFGACLMMLALAALVIKLFDNSDKADAEASKPNMQESMLSQSATNYVLEIRNVDLSAAEWGGIGMWRKIAMYGNASGSFLDREDSEKAYPSKLHDALETSDLMYGRVYKTVAGAAVEFWPIPTFVAAPPAHPTNAHPSASVWDGRNGASLAFTQFLWQEDDETESTQELLERLFAFFDTNPDVPEAFLVVEDGSVLRDLNSRPNGGGLPVEPLPKPAIVGGNAALLVSRSDRVDKYIRPHALMTQGYVDPANVKTDQDRFWHFYHRMNSSRDPDAFLAYYMKNLAGERDVFDSPVPSTSFWQMRLPSFWSQTKDKAYKPSVFLPVRWTGNQLKQFDESAVAGYLHRPVKVALRDSEGKPLPREAVMVNLREGYDRAVAPLAEGRKPTRLFFDGSQVPNWALTVREALKNLPDGGPDPERESDTYDIGVRIGNLGAVSALGQIALATMAGHDDGRVGITLNTGDGDHADFIVVTPPDDDAREYNRRHQPSHLFLGGF